MPASKRPPPVRRVPARSLPARRIVFDDDLGECLDPADADPFAAAVIGEITDMLLGAE
jgi:hypothetical protein